MIETWVLVMIWSGYKNGGMVTIPGYATHAECKAAGLEIKDSTVYKYCIPGPKVYNEKKKE